MTRMAVGVTIACLAACGCTPVISKIALAAPLTPSRGVEVREENEPPPEGARVVGIVTAVAQASWQGRDALIDRLVDGAKELGCTRLWGVRVFHRGKMNEAIGVCGVVEVRP